MGTSPQAWGSWRRSWRAEEDSSWLLTWCKELAVFLMLKLGWRVVLHLYYELLFRVILLLCFTMYKEMSHIIPYCDSTFLYLKNKVINLLIDYKSIRCFKVKFYNSYLGQQSYLLV